MAATRPPKTDDIIFLCLARSLLPMLPALPLLESAPWYYFAKTSSGLPPAPVSVTASISPCHQALGYYVQYDVALECPVTGLVWTVSKRYSQLLRFYKELVKAHTTSPHPWIAYIMQTPFPKKHFDAERPRVIAERWRYVHFLMGHLWSISSLGDCESKSTSLYRMIQDFLEIPCCISFGPMLGPINDPCAICLDDIMHLQSAERKIIFQLVCGHYFHQECLQDCDVLSALPTLGDKRHRRGYGIT
ncbi:hypothetical protein ACHHYP_09365 [Achlya hypogyna]|uniref:PX domain-containing protein n=1 Tax=Achlya hypogyna TaxID=1202772 RepID=A0A1V9ZIY8_ACHHY|nr:hypothetical protein ACHHYP_09365 [Achlya hypogyna]